DPIAHGAASIPGMNKNVLVACVLVMAGCTGDVGSMGDGTGSDPGGDPGGGDPGGGGPGGGGSGTAPAGLVFGAYKDTSINMDWNTNVISTSVSGTRAALV